MDLLHTKQLEHLIAAIIKKNVNAETFQWLQEKKTLIQQEMTANQLNSAFASVPRRTGKKDIDVTHAESKQFDFLLEGFFIQDWTIDRLCRIWLLMQIYPSEEDIYKRKIETLFLSAEMNEMVALFSSLPVLAYPKEWRLRCAEGIRSNIGLVLEAIMHNNPYPAKYLDEAAWNQMVLKAFFTDKDINRIVGLDERVNERLSAILFDYAHERWAAHRTVNIQLWRLVGKFIDESNFFDIQKLFQSENVLEKKAAALVCAQSKYEPIKVLLNQAPDVKSAIEENKLSWQNLLQ